MIREEEGQGALEYILMIAVALAVVAVIVVFMRGKGIETRNKAQRAYNYTNESIEALLAEATG